MLVVLLYLAAFAPAWWFATQEGVPNPAPGGLYDGVLGASPSESGEAFSIRKLQPGSPFHRAGLREGDLVLSTDGVPATDVQAFIEAMNARQPGDRNVLQVRRVSADPNAPVEEIEAVVESRSRLPRRILDPRVAVHLLVFTFVGFVFVGTGTVVGFIRPTETAARLLVWVGAAFALLLALMSWSAVGLSQSLDMPPQPILLAQHLSWMVGAVALLHLFLVFPAPHPLHTRLRALGPAWLQRMGGGVWALYMIPIVIQFALSLGPRGFGRWWLLVWVVPLLVTVPAVVHHYRQPRTPLARTQLQWILGSLIILAIALIVGPGLWLVTGGRFYFLKATPGSEMPFSNTLFTMAALAPFPVATAIAVLRFRVFAVSVAVRALVVMVVLVAGYFVVVYGVGNAVVGLYGPTALTEPLTIGLAAVAIAALAHPVRSKLQMLLDRLLYRYRVARDRFLAEANERLGRAQPPGEVAAFLQDYTLQRLGLRGAWLVTADDLTAGDSGGEAPSLPGPADSLLGRVANVSGPVALASAREYGASPVPELPAEDPDLAPWYAAGARLLVPLGAGATQPGAEGPDEVTGVWVVGQRRNNALFDQDDVDLFARVGQQAAVLLDNARLNRQQTQQELVRQELEHAKDIQEGMLREVDQPPPGLDVAAVCRSAEAVGGDFYDVLDLGDGVAAVVVADASGHGMAAALLAASTRTALRFELGRQRSPEGALTAVNTWLSRAATKGTFVAVTCLVVDAKTGRIELASGGQMPPLLRRHDGRVETIDTVEPRLPLGVVPQLQYATRSLPLMEGDTLLVYTDGVVETTGGSHGEALFGFEGLEQTVAHLPVDGAAALTDGVLAAVTAHQVGNQLDDVTVLALRCDGSDDQLPAR